MDWFNFESPLTYFWKFKCRLSQFDSVILSVKTKIIGKLNISDGKYS